MKRRDFLVSAGALAMAGPVFAASGVQYKPGLVDSELAAGKTVFVDFYTDWCTTCRAQQKTISALKQENPAYEQAISFVSVNWDDHANGPLARRLEIPRRSTLVVLRGDEELGRIVAGTRRDGIKVLMDTALAAARA